MKLISAVELHQLIRTNADIQVVDVREPYEYQKANIGSIHIPMGEICARTEELAKEKTIIIVCRSGKRAEAVANILETDYNCQKVLVLEGGVLAWKDAIDQTLDLD